MFDEWSPLQLASTLGLRIDLRDERGGRNAYIIGKNGKHHYVDHPKACRVLKRLARMKGIDPVMRPLKGQRALRNGKEPLT